MAEPLRSEDLTLAPNEFALVLDRTNGAVHTYCGPSNTSLSAQESPTTFDYASKHFTSVDMPRAKQLKKLAPEGWYVILKNPSANGIQPEEGKKARMPELLVGHKVNIPGPTSFALWPGQMAQVVQGHHLRQDEYLIARVYDGVAARKSCSGSDSKDGGDTKEVASLAPKDFTPGHLFIIKGTEASFYIPPTGIEVVRDEESGVVNYVRSAVSLERLEYCLLRDQDGNKRYVRGPAVVFPKPTEAFVTKADGVTRKFKAIQLGVKNGIHVGVIADYKEGDEVVKAGSELFIVGEDTPIYFPREEHSIIKYGDSDVNFGVAIPPGEARYVMERRTGAFRTEKGPTIFLPDPRTECIVRRILDQRLCALMYPGNAEALQINQALAAAARPQQPGIDAIEEATSGGGRRSALIGAASASAAFNYSADVTPSDAVSSFHGDVTNRRGQYRPPRTVTIDSKYEGAVTMDIHEGYAVMLVTKRGDRRVIKGPQTALLDYDEVPHVLTLSTGKPKNMDKPLKTVYLMVANNYVTDIVDVETQDYCKVKVKLSYRLNFEGAEESEMRKWFSVENYVKLLCDHMRSMIRNRVRRIGIKEFYQNSADLLRDLILGKAKDEGGARPGRLFSENNLRIFDVEVLEVNLDPELQKLMERQERAAVQQELELEELQRRALFYGSSKIHQSAIIAAEEDIRSKQEASKRTKQLDEAETKAQAQELAKATAERANEIADLERQKAQAEHEQRVQFQAAMDALKIAIMTAETGSTKERMTAISPNLVSALQAFGDQATLERMATAMGAQSFLQVLGGSSLADVLANALKGTVLGDRLPAALNGIKAPATKQLST